MINPGKNIAVKVPRYRWEDTVAFYRDRVGLKPIRVQLETVAFEFGEMILWIDKVEHQSQTDVWFELLTDDPDDALRALDCQARDELEHGLDVEGEGKLVGHLSLQLAGVTAPDRRLLKATLCNAT